MAEVMNLELLGELVIGLRDETRELRAEIRAQGEVMQNIIRMLRRIEDRMDRIEEQQLALMRNDQDLERRMRVLERAREGT